MSNSYSPGPHVPRGNLPNNVQSPEGNHGSHRGPQTSKTQNRVRPKMSPDILRAANGLAEAPGTSATLAISEDCGEVINHAEGLLCWFIYYKGKCIYSAEDCLYRHYGGPPVAERPVQVEEGRPAVAGKNARRDKPIYKIWPRKQMQAAEQGHTPKHKAIQRRSDFEAKNSNSDTGLTDPSYNQRAPEPFKNIHINQGMPHKSLATCHLPAQLPPASHDSVSYTSRPSQEPAGKASTGFDHIINQSPAFRVAHRASCPRPLDLPEPKKFKVEHTLIGPEHRDNCSLFTVFDSIMNIMGQYQQSNYAEAQSLIDLANDKLETAHGSQARVDDFAVDRYDKLFSPDGDILDTAPIATPIRKRKLWEASLPDSDDTVKLPSKVRCIAEKIKGNCTKEEMMILGLKEQTQKLATAMANIGDQNGLPEGCIVHSSTS